MEIAIILKIVVSAAFRGILLYLCGWRTKRTFLCARYSHPKSWVSGKGLTLALADSISGVPHLRNLSNIISHR